MGAVKVSIVSFEKYLQALSGTRLEDTLITSSLINKVSVISTCQLRTTTESV